MSDEGISYVLDFAFCFTSLKILKILKSRKKHFLTKIFFFFAFCRFHWNIIMAAQLSLRISLEGGRVTKTIQFDPNTTVFDACRIIRDKFAEAVQGQGEFT